MGNVSTTMGNVLASETNQKQLNHPSNGGDGDSDRAAARKRSHSRVEIQVPPPLPHLYPESYFVIGEERKTSISEEDAIQALKAEWNRRYTGASSPQMPDFIMIDLKNFTFYHPDRDDSQMAKGRRHEMESLLFLASKTGYDTFLFDGELSCGNLKCYVEGVRFSSVAVDGYCDQEVHSVLHSISIQSKYASRHERNVWFLLKRPSSFYARYHEPYLWVADLAKHFIDFVHEKSEKGMVGLHDFKRSFYKLLVARHGCNPLFEQWLSRAPSTDFRTSINAHFEYIWKEHYNLWSQGVGLPDPRRLLVWDEINADSLTAVPEQSLENVKTMETVPTVVTPYVYGCFKNMVFADQLKEQGMDDKVRKIHNHHVARLGFPVWQDKQTQAPSDIGPMITPPGKIFVGDVVGVPRDSETLWRDSASLWFALVQGVTELSNGRFLHVIWLYRPSDTFLAETYYPHGAELFLSDNCNCERVETFKETDVVCKISVTWKLNDAEKGIQKGPFVSRKYLTNDHCFVSLKKHHFECDCERRARKSAFADYRDSHEIGDCVYEKCGSNESDLLEPVVITGFTEATEQVEVRRLVRKRAVGFPDAPLNELVWSNMLKATYPSRLFGKCSVKFFIRSDVDAGLPSPYDRRGTGHMWFFTSQMLLDAVSELQEVPHGYTETAGSSFTSIHKPLQGMDLFCGGGNFGRGLEDGGAVKMKVAVDIDKVAAHTYRANTNHPDDTEIFLGSVDDYLSKALRGVSSTMVAMPGEIGFICAGSPCRAFSTAQLNRSSTKSFKNASLVASVAAFIDLYRPKYAILENVTQMATNRKEFGDKNIFSPLLCCLVGMGYQASVFYLDAYSFGAAQSRSRLFVAITAPGLDPIEHPQLSHAHHVGAGNRSLGKIANGETFGDRQFVPTPFPFVSIREATGDLPYVIDGRVGICVEFPDHRVSGKIDGKRRDIYAKIPTTPPGCSLMHARAQGLIGDDAFQALTRAWKSRYRTSTKSRALTRVNAAYVFGTITRHPIPDDAFGPPILHYEQPRMITVQEARRAQDWPDHEVLIGRPAQQWATIGDGVCRSVAFALGLALRDAYVASEDDGKAKRAGRASAANGLVASKDGVVAYRAGRAARADGDGAVGGSTRETSRTNDFTITNRTRVRRTAHATETERRIHFTSESTEAGLSAAPRPKRTKISGNLFIRTLE